MILAKVASTRLRCSAMIYCSTQGMVACRASVDGRATRCRLRLPGGKGSAVYALSASRCDGRWFSLEQIRADVAFVDHGGHDAPRANDTRSQIGLDGEAASVEPLPGRRRF